MSRLDDAIGSAFDSYDSDKSGYIEASRGWINRERETIKSSTLNTIEFDD